MSRVLRLRRGTTAETNTFTGKLAEVTVDTTTMSLVVHDNVTPGGHRIATEAYVEANKAVTSIGNVAPNVDVQAGSMWFDNDTGRLYVYYSNSWVDASPSISSGSIGNLTVDDVTISSNAGVVRINGNLQLGDNKNIYLGDTNDLVWRVVPAGTDGNPYRRAQITTNYNGNANVGLGLSTTNGHYMFFNPESGNIGINTREPNASLDVRGEIQSYNFKSSSGSVRGGYNFDVGQNYGTGLFHITSNVANSIEIRHQDATGLKVTDIGDVYIPAGNVHIGQDLNFTPENSRLTYGDTQDGFSQFALQNKSPNISASTDISLFADNGNDAEGFGDVGITSSVYADPAYTLYKANDVYLLSASNANIGGKLILNTYDTNDVVIATGGVMEENIMTRFKHGVGILPGATNEDYDLGSSMHRWRNVYTGNLYLGANKLVNGNTAPSSTAPVSPNEGQLWFDLDTGHLFVRVGSVWVDTSLGSNIVAVPEHSTGKSGDVPGLVAYNADYAYYCAGTYDGSTNIWKRVAWSMDTW